MATEPKKITARLIVKKYNISYSSLNYYTAIGLLPLLGKYGNARVYDENEIKPRLQKIAELSQQGYPLNLIRKKLSGN